MKYLEKSFTCPTAPVMTQEAWDLIWATSTDHKIVAQLASEGKEFDYDAILAAKPPATESEKRRADTVAPAYCPNCHCRPYSYRHTETCIEPNEAD